jgi:hypothetical protein
MKYTACIFILLFVGREVFSQNYTRDAGLRFGKGVFISYRQFYDEERAVEGFVGFTQRNFRIAGFREYFSPLARVRSQNLRMMYGYGIHAGVSYTNKYKFLNQIYYHDWLWSPQFGMDGILGAEYLVPDFPILITAAIQPYFEYSITNFFSIQPFNFIVVFKYRF